MMFDMREMQEQVLYNAIEKESGKEMAQNIVYDWQKQMEPEDNAAWVQYAMGKLESNFDKAAVKRIRMQCQCGYGMEEKIALVKKLLESSRNFEELANHDSAKATGLSCSDGELYLEFPFCPCPMLADVDRLETDAWCQCTTGYSKVLFEAAFGCEVDVELLKSIKMGGDRCLMKIIPHGDVWKQETP